jgi:phage recombination protein Bet
MNARPQLALPRTAETLPAIAPERLPYHPSVQERFGIDRASWRALVEAIFPTARSVEGVILALSYCRARRLDPMKRPVHIVAVWDRERKRYVDTVWPGIGELRTTAMRTGLYAGCDPAQFGPDITQTFSGKAGGDDSRDISVTVTFPEWAQVTVYRMVNGQRVPVPGPRVYWLETYATVGRDGVPNEMWRRRPRGMIEKCAEAAALRRAFPEEIGNDLAAEEIGGASPDETSIVTVAATEEPPAAAQAQPEGEPAEPPRRRQRRVAAAEAPQPAAAGAPQPAAAGAPPGELF